MRNYSYKVVDDLIARYEKAGGYCYQVSEGTLGSGDWILYNNGIPKMSNFVIKEVFVNSQSSTHTIRRYKELPKKYLDILNNLEGEC